MMVPVLITVARRIQRPTPTPDIQPRTSASVRTTPRHGDGRRQIPRCRRSESPSLRVPTRGAAVTTSARRATRLGRCLRGRRSRRPTLPRGSAADPGSVPSTFPRDVCSAGGGRRLDEVVVGSDDPQAVVVDRQPGKRSVEVAFPIGATPVLDRFGGMRVFVVGPRGTRVELRPVPTALASGAPSGDPGTDLVGWRGRIGAVFDDHRHTTLVVIRRCVARVMHPTHDRAPPTVPGTVGRTGTDDRQDGTMQPPGRYALLVERAVSPGATATKAATGSGHPISATLTILRNHAKSCSLPRPALRSPEVDGRGRTSAPWPTSAASTTARVRIQSHP